MVCHITSAVQGRFGAKKEAQIWKAFHKILLRDLDGPTDGFSESLETRLSTALMPSGRPSKEPRGRCALDGVKDGNLVVAGLTLCVGWCQRRHSRRCLFVRRCALDGVKDGTLVVAGSVHGIMEGLDALIPSRWHFPSKVPSDSLHLFEGELEVDGFSLHLFVPKRLNEVASSSTWTRTKDGVHFVSLFFLLVQVKVHVALVTWWAWSSCIYIWTLTSGYRLLAFKARAVNLRQRVNH